MRSTPSRCLSRCGRPGSAGCWSQRPRLRSSPSVGRPRPTQPCPNRRRHKHFPRPHQSIPAVGIEWGSNGDRMGIEWGSNGDRMGIEWGSNGDRAGIEWGSSGVSSGIQRGARGDRVGLSSVGSSGDRVGIEWGSSGDRVGIQPRASGDLEWSQIPPSSDLQPTFCWSRSSSEAQGSVRDGDQWCWWGG